ncbi:MAG: phage holin family protein [Xenococcaceae cyanobacterium]
MNIVGLLIAWLVTSVSLLIISKLPTGVEIDGFQKAAISAIVFGILNALVRPILKTLALPMAVVFSSFLIALVLNMIIFGLAAYLVEGFRLRWGIWSALIGSVALSIINSLIYSLLSL